MSHIALRALRASRTLLFALLLAVPAAQSRALGHGLAFERAQGLRGEHRGGRSVPRRDAGTGLGSGDGQEQCDEESAGGAPGALGDVGHGGHGGARFRRGCGSGGS